jgi:hypothetical protein
VFEEPARRSARSARRCSYAASPPLDGALLWMAGAVYECQVTVEPEQIFCNLLGVHVQHSAASLQVCARPTICLCGFKIQGGQGRGR